MSILEDKGELLKQIDEHVEQAEGLMQRVKILDDTYKEDPELQKMKADLKRREQEQKKQEKQAEKDREREEPVSDYLRDFIGATSERASTPPIPTGFKRLDSALGGGLHESLICIGAQTSTGKTAFTMQICDQIAKSGHDVIVIALEMSRFELMARSISRHTYIRARNDKNGKIAWAKSGLGITDGSRRKYYNKQENALIADALSDYSEYTDNIFIIEGIGNVGVTEIRDIVEQHIRDAKAKGRESGEKPVLIIDYLQLIAPYDTRATDKTNTDKAILELKRISRDNKIPVIAISSVNRGSYRKNSDYKGAVTEDALKESGAIEFSCDIIMGLQFQSAGSDFDPDVEYQKPTREMQIVLLKNRQGERGKKINFNYLPTFNYFEETGTLDNKISWEKS